MIDWPQTESKFGVTEIINRPVVVCKCDGCGRERDVRVRVKSRVIDGQMAWYCPKCVGQREDVRRKLQDSTVRQWKKEDYQEERKKCSLKLWEDEKFRNKVTEGDTKHFSQNEVKQKIGEFYRRKYSSPAYREKFRKQSLKLWMDEGFRQKVAAGVGRSPVLQGRAPSNLHTVFESMLKSVGMEEVKQADLMPGYVKEAAIGPYNFDFLLKIKDKRPILVELQGGYWHGLAESIARDERKASYVAQLPEYDFKVVWELEFYTKDRVINLLKKWLGLAPQVELKNFAFGDVLIKMISPKEARPFFTRYHYSGSLGRGGQIFGAFLGEEMIGGVVYSSVVRKEVAERLGVKCQEVVELSRFAIADDRHKQNFASWLISRTVAFLKCRMVVTFADETFGHQGTIYKAAGFRLDGVVAPSYWYADQGGWIMHKKTLWEHAASLRMSETEFAEKHGYQKIYGGRRFRYLLNLGGGA